MLLGLLNDAQLEHHMRGTTLIADRNYYGRDFETALSAAGIDLLRPTRKGEKTRPGGHAAADRAARHPLAGNPMISDDHFGQPM